MLDAKLLQLNRFCDDRGFFEELYSQNVLPEFNCLQVNFSKSKRNVLRGLHIVPFGKVVTCLKGRIFDVVIDVRENSVTYLQWYGVELNEDNKLSLYVPSHCGHGFLALEDDSFVIYAQDGLYNPNIENSVNAFDPTFNIAWPECDKYIQSDKDKAAPFVRG